MIWGKFRKKWYILWPITFDRSCSETLIEPYSTWGFWLFNKSLIHTTLPVLMHHARIWHQGAAETGCDILELFYNYLQGQNNLLGPVVSGKVG